jgi:UDPglucose--hexose-1-phosphate uridylyltransferase
LFRNVIISLNTLLPNIDFNVCFEDSPNNTQDRQLHHWYIQIIPRKGSWAGFELGTECYISTCLPEQAATKLKKICNRGN